MTTINIHKDKLLPAAFAYQQRKLKESTACRVAEDGIVSLDIDVVQRIFGEE